MTPRDDALAVKVLIALAIWAALSIGALIVGGLVLLGVPWWVAMVPGCLPLAFVLLWGYLAAGIKF